MRYVVNGPVVDATIANFVMSGQRVMDSDTIVFCTPNPFKRGQYVEAGIVSGAYFNHYEVPTHTGKMRGHGTCKYAYLKE